MGLIQNLPPGVLTTSLDWEEEKIARMSIARPARAERVGAAA